MDERPSQHRITQLIEGNYEVWRVQMSSILVALDLWDVVRPSSEVPTEEMIPKGPKGVREQQKKRELARSKIILAIDPSQVPFVLGMENPREMWEALEQVHRSSSVNSALSLRRSFLRMVKNEDESAIGWIGRVRARALELSHTPCPATTIDIILVITEGLSPEYAPVLTQLESLPFDSLTIPAVTTRITGFEAQLRRAQASASDFSSAHALVARGEVTCHLCGGVGHYIRECPTPKSFAKPKKTRGGEEEGGDGEGCLSSHVARLGIDDSDTEVLRLY